MYNRYVPSANGGYERHIMRSAAPSPAPPPVREAIERKEQAAVGAACKRPVTSPLPLSLETEDLLVLLVLLLVFMSGQDAEHLPLLITIAAFILLQ